MSVYGRQRCLALGLFLVLGGCERQAPAEPPVDAQATAPSSAAQPVASAGPSIERGKAYYTTCAGCHGNFGEGNYGMHGPNLTVLDGEYLLTQLRNFRSEVRGGTADFYGWQMNGRTKALPDDLAIQDVVEFILTLPEVTSVSKAEGNASRGQEIYVQQCASCHGSQGEGQPGLKAPRLAGLESWYQLQQLQNFRNGIRGTAAADTAGQQMKPFADALVDDAALQDVISYIGTLAGR